MSQGEAKPEEESAPEVLMLGEKKLTKLERERPGQFDVCELFSPSRVAAVASEKGSWAAGALISILWIRLRGRVGI